MDAILSKVKEKSRFLKILETTMKEDIASGGQGDVTDPNTVGAGVTTGVSGVQTATANLKQQALAVLMQDPEFQAAQQSGDQTKISSYFQNLLSQQSGSSTTPTQ